MNYIIGTRGSKLALVQANYVCSRLQEKYETDSFEIKVIKTKGDLIQDRPLNQIGDKGLFVTEIEEQILDGRVDIGVHSMKDMPAFPEEGLMFTKEWEREDPRDVLILREKKSLSELRKGAIIGTGSIRRSTQLLKLRPDLNIVDIRGNVDTRLKKMEEQKLDGIVLAAAGLKRLHMEDRITQYLESEEMISAPAQGVLALEIRSDRIELNTMLDALADEETVQIAKAERGFLAEMGADCHVPVGAICKKREDGLYQLKAMFGDRDGRKIVYADVSGEDTQELAQLAAKEIRSKMAGEVYLVGGGPGDPGLITVKGMQCIKHADCIVYDRLSSPKLLDTAKAGCELIYVGKENHNHTMKQEDINRLLVEKAMEHAHVVRLKGGDVYVFGRGGEEGMYLKQHGIRFQVVPGISSSIAGLAYAGIPITHRGIATGFHVVTAHNQRDELADIDFEAMASGRDTCVFLMGLSKVGDIADNLIEAGMAPDTQTAVISHATTPEQKTCMAPLNQIADKVIEERLTSPALIVVGDVVGLRKELNFFEQTTWNGKKYLVPKIGSKKSRITELLEEKGALVEEVMVGTIEHRSRKFSREEIKSADWMIFTSRNGVDSFFENLNLSGMDTRALMNVKIASIGSSTASELKKHGIQPDLIPEEYHSSALIEQLREQLKKEDVVWYLKAANADEKMKTALEEACKFHEIIQYENVETDSGRLEDEELLAYDGIFFSCGSSVQRILSERSKIFYENISKKGNIYVIGPQCRNVVEQFGITNMHEAERATYESFLNMLTY